MNMGSKSVFPFCVVASILVLFALGGDAPLTAQSFTSFAEPVSGVLRQESGGSMNGFRVELSSSAGWETSWADVRPDGTFQVSVHGSPEKQYLLRVVDRGGRVVHDDIVRTDTGPLEIYLYREATERPVSGVVSLEQLRHPVPKKAVREYQRAEKANRKGDLDSALQHLRKAIAIHPEFTEAHNSMGVKFMLLKRYGEAAQAFEEALRLKPDAAEALSNLGIAYHCLEQYEDAERLIRASLERRPESVKTRFSLALVLLTKGERNQEAEATEILVAVADHIPQAHLCLATMFEGQANNQAAAREVAAYLQTEDMQYRPMAEQWLSKLQVAPNRAAAASIH